MQNIWAPWRMQYILQEKEEGCIFCLEKEKKDHEAHILYRGNHSFVMINKFPYSNGHLLIAPYQHVKDLECLNQDELLDMLELIKVSTGILKDALNSDGFNIGANLGRVAGAGVENHLHFHIVPRWDGDTNFMPILSETRVISEHLEDTFNKLIPGFRRLK